jgi:hypothetical protein
VQSWHCRGLNVPLEACPDHHVSLGVAESHHESRSLGEVIGKVRVGIHDIGRPCGGKTRLECRPIAPLKRCNHARSHSPCQLSRAVRRAVVSHDDLYPLGPVGKRRLGLHDGLGNRNALIQAGDHHGKSRLVSAFCHVPRHERGVVLSRHPEYAHVDVSVGIQRIRLDEKSRSRWRELDHSADRLVAWSATATHCARDLALPLFLRSASRPPNAT